MHTKITRLATALGSSFAVACLLGATVPALAAPAVSFEFCVIEECTPAYQREAKDHGLEITPPSSSECAVPKECMSMAQNLYQMPLDATNCTAEKFHELQEKIDAIDAKYIEIGKKNNIDMAFHTPFGVAPHSKVIAGLGGLLLKQFSTCEEKKLFPANPNECVTKSCKNILAEIQDVPVNEEGCKKDLTRAANQVEGFNFETVLLENVAKKHVEACQDANITKIKFGRGDNIFLQREIYKRELPNMEAGNKLENEVQAALDNFEANAQNCTMDFWQSLYTKLKEMRDQYAQVQSIGNEGQLTFDRLVSQLNKNIDKCKNAGVFPENIEGCITDECKKVIAQIKAVPVSEEGCDSGDIGFDFRGRPFNFEESLRKKAYEDHVEACKDANFTPVRNIGLGGHLYKKDIPFFEAGEKAVEALESALDGLDAKKTTAERCSRELFETTGQNLQAMKDNFGKLSAVKNYKKMNYENLEFARDRQAIRCYNAHLFPFTVEYGTCFTGHCKDTLEEIENFKVGERSCDRDIHGLSPNVMVMLTPEAEYIQDRQNELYNQCVDAGFLDKSWRKKVKKHPPVAQTTKKSIPEAPNSQLGQVSAVPSAPVAQAPAAPATPTTSTSAAPKEQPSMALASVAPNVSASSAPKEQPSLSVASIAPNVPTTSGTVQRVMLKEDANLTPEQAALLKRFYLMDVKEKTGGPDGTTQIIPFIEIGEKLKGLQATPEDCNAEKVFIPIYSSIVYFEDLFEAEQLPLPKELVDLRNQVWQYRDMCVKAGL